MEHIVYVVDDDDTVRQSVVRLLESADMHALGFSSAEAFLSHPFEDLPSCVILDMQMPTFSFGWYAPKRFIESELIPARET